MYNKYKLKFTDIYKNPLDELSWTHVYPLSVLNACKNLKKEHVNGVICGSVCILC